VDSNEVDSFMRAMLRATLFLALVFVTNGTVRAAGLSCSPPGANLASPEPQHFTHEQRQELLQSYSAPEIRGLRSAFNSYLAGTAKENTPRVLAGVPHELLREPFLLLVDVRAPFGGQNLLIQFKRHPDAVYRVWIYRLSTGVYDVRSWDRAACSAAQQHFMQVEYGDIWSLVPGG
jgi:hypothetical protein